MSDSSVIKMERPKYKDLLDYIVKVLKDIRQPENIYISLLSILKAFNYPLPFSEIQEIGKYFETRGWAKVINTIGDVRVQLTSAGIVYIEEKEEKDTAFNAAYKSFLDQLLKERPKEELVVTIHKAEDDPKKRVIELLEKVNEKIKTQEGREVDYNKDIEVIKLEVSKLNPDLKLIEIKLNNLSTISYIGPEIQELKSYLTLG